MENPGYSERGPIKSRWFEEGAEQHKSSFVHLVLLGSFLTVSTALKNADSLLQDVMNAVDTNRDGRIDYSGAFKEKADTPFN